MNAMDLVLKAMRSAYIMRAVQRGGMPAAVLVRRLLIVFNEAGLIGVGGASVSDISALVTASGDTAVLDNTNTYLPWDTESFDTDTMHDTVTNNSRLTATSAGKYIVGGHVEWAANATGYREVVLFKNRTSIISRVLTDIDSAVTHIQAITGIVSLVASDYAELRVYQNSTATVNITGGGTNSAFWAVRVAQ